MTFQVQVCNKKLGKLKYKTKQNNKHKAEVTIITACNLGSRFIFQTILMQIIFSECKTITNIAQKKGHLIFKSLLIHLKHCNICLTVTQFYNTMYYINRIMFSIILSNMKLILYFIFFLFAEQREVGERTQSRSHP